MFNKVMGFITAVAVATTPVVVLNAEDAEMSGAYLKDKYIIIPSLVADNKGDLHKLINPDAGTVEFWFKPDWKLNDDNTQSPRFWKSLFFWGNFSNRDSMGILKSNSVILYLITASNGSQFSANIHTNMKYNPNELIWRHVALCWDFRGEKKTVTFFLNGKNTALMHPQPDKWKAAETEFDGIASEGDILIGAGRGSLGGGLHKGEISDTVIPEFEIAQFRVSDVLRYNDVFEPQPELSADKNTLLYMPLADNLLDGDYYKDGKKAGKIRGKKVKIGK